MTGTGKPPVIVYRLGSLGDTIVALPCFHAIRRAFPTSQLLALTNVPVSSKAAPLAAILQPGGLIDGAIAYPVGTRSPLALARLAWTIRRTGARTLVYLAAGRGLSAVRRDLWFFRVCGITRIIGAPVTGDLHDPRIDTATGQEEPEAERLARTLAELDARPADPDQWDLRLTEAERARAAGVLDGVTSPVLVINTGGKDPAKDWGVANWQGLLAVLGNDLPGWTLAIVGAGDDRTYADAVTSMWPGAALNLCGALSPRETAALMARARLFMGHDSGPGHLAASVGTPTLGLFGNGNRPRRWHPYGAHCRVIQEPRGVTAIAIADVRAAALAMAH